MKVGICISQYFIAVKYSPKYKVTPGLNLRSRMNAGNLRNFQPEANVHYI